MIGEGWVKSPSPLLSKRGTNIALIRYVVLVVSVAVVVVGALIIAGQLVPRSFPDDYRIIMGVVIVLYGVYRFLIAFFQRPSRRG